MPDDGEFVRVMSLHKSKGLTSKVTVVLGCIQGLIPGANDDDTNEEEKEATLQEQRRLFYVAVTRCTEILVLSSSVRMEKKMAFNMRAQIRRAQGNSVNVVASQFMDELGPQAPLAWVGTNWAARGYPQQHNSGVLSRQTA